MSKPSLSSMLFSARVYRGYDFFCLFCYIIEGLFVNKIFMRKVSPLSGWFFVCPEILFRGWTWAKKTNGRMHFCGLSAGGAGGGLPWRLWRESSAWANGQYRATSLYWKYSDRSGECRVTIRCTDKTEILSYIRAAASGNLINRMTDNFDLLRGEVKSNENEAKRPILWNRIRS